MSVRLAPDNVVHLEGRCPVDDADTLLQWLVADPARSVDWRGCDGLHTALVQILLAMRPILHGPCRDPFLQQWIAPLLQARGHVPATAELDAGSGAPHARAVAIGAGP